MMKKILQSLALAALLLLPMATKAQLAIPFTNGFESEAALSGWTQMAGSDAGLMDEPHSGDSSFAFTYYFYPDYLITPEMTGTASGVQIEFWYKNNSSYYPETFKVGYSTTDTAMASFTWDTPVTISNQTWTSYSAIYPAGTKYVCIYYLSDDMYNLFIDDFAAMAPPSCMPVSALVLDAATSSSLTISWSDLANSGATYSVYDMSDTSLLASGLTATTYTATGLTAATAYTLGVVANCSATDASSMMTLVAATDCEGGSCTITIEGTDSYGDGWNGNTISIVQNGGVKGTFTLSSGSSLTETFSVCDGVPVNFVWTTGSYASETSFIIYDGGNASVFSAGGDSLSDTVFFTLADPCPSCLSPVVTVSDLTPTGLTLNWSDDNSGATYTVYSDSTVVASNLTANTYTFSGLTPATYYTFGVVANCSATDASSMSVVEVMTSCVASPVPFVESFDTASATLGCWNVVSMNSANPVTLSMLGDNIALRFSSYSSASDYNQYAFSPELNYTGTETELYYSVRYATYGSSDHLRFGYTTASSTDTNDYVWTSIYYNTTGNSDIQYYIASLPVNTKHVAIHYYGNYAYYAWIDSVVVTDEAMVVPEPDSVSFTFAVNNAAMGTITPAPGTYQYAVGDSISLVATPNAGYVLQSWTLSYTDVTGASYSETADATGTDFFADEMEINVIPSYFVGYTFTVTANFVDPSVVVVDSLVVNITVSDPTMGTTTPAPGTYMLASGDSLALSATANTGYFFQGWAYSYYYGGQYYYDTLLNADATTITIDADYWMDASPLSFQPLFTNQAPDSVTIIVTCDPTMGTVTGSGTYPDNGTFTATATPNNGYVFVDWLVYIGYESDSTYVGYAAANPWTYYSDENYYVVAEFETAPAEPTAIECTGSSCFLTINGTDEYGDGWNGASLELYQHDTLVSRVTMDSGSVFTTTVEVCDAYPVNFVWNSGEWDSEINFFVSDASGNQLWGMTDVTILVDGDMFVYVTNPCSDPVVNVDEDTVEVTIAVNDITMGTTIPAPGTYQYGTIHDVEVEAVPNTNYYLMGWVLSYIDEDGAPYADTAITSEHQVSILASYLYGLTNVTITALFTDDTTFAPVIDTMYVNVAVNDATMGTTVPAPGLHYFITGQDASVVAVPNDGYRIAGWSFQVTAEEAGVVETLIDTTLMYAVDDFFDLYGGWTVEEGDGAYHWNITAIFEEGEPVSEEYLTLVTAVNDATMGTITPAPGTHQYTVGQAVQLNMTPTEGHYLHSVHITMTHPIMGVISDETILASDSVDFTEPLVVEEEMLGFVISVTAIFAVNGQDPPIGIAEVETADFTVNAIESTIVVLGAEGRQVSLFDVNGRLMNREVNAGERVEFNVANSGVYLVKVGNAAAKRVVVVR